MDFPFQDQADSQRQKCYSDRPVHDKKAGNARTIARATLITMIGLFLAKLTGFLREMLIVPKFGYGILSDAYINAFQLPDLFYELLVGGAVAAVLTPTLSSGIERGREKQAWQGVSIFMSVCMLVMTGALLLGLILAPWLVKLITGAAATDVSAELQDMAAICTPITRILFGQTFFMMLISLTHGVLTAYKRFTPAALGVVIYNIAYMLVLLIFGKNDQASVQTVAWGVVGSAMLYFFFQFVAARHELPYFHFSLDLQHPGFKRLLALAIPTLLSGSVLHLNNIIMNRYANGLQDLGAVTSLRQCLTTYTLPYSIFTVAIGTVMLPNLSGFIAQKDERKESRFFTASLRRALFYVWPCAIIFAILNVETIQAIFQWNPETYPLSKVVMTAGILRWFCLSMLAQTFVFLTNQAFYARKITRLALLSGIVALLLNPLFLYIFVQKLALGATGIGMAHAAYSTLTAILLYCLYIWQKPTARPGKILAYVLRLLFCGGIMALVLLALRSLPLAPSLKILQLVYYAFELAVAALSYYVAGIMIQLRETVRLQSKIRQLLHLPPVRRFDFS